MINSKENQVKTTRCKTFPKPILICELIWLAFFGCLASNLQASGNEVHRYLSDLPFEMPEMALPENSDWISCSGCENSRSSGEKPNFDPKPQKNRNDSSYQ